MERTWRNNPTAYVEEAPNEQKNKWVLHSICGSESFVSDKSTESFAGNFSAIDHESATTHQWFPAGEWVRESVLPIFFRKLHR